VLLDQVDELLVTYVLPGLGEGAGIELFDADDATPREVRAAVERRAGELVRDEYGKDARARRREGSAPRPTARRRRELFEAFEKLVAARGLVLQPPSKLPPRPLPRGPPLRRRPKGRSRRAPRDG